MNQRVAEMRAMIPTKLCSEEVLRSYLVLDPRSVPGDDPRLTSVPMDWTLEWALLDGARPWQQTDVVRLVAWRDGSLGLAYLWADEQRRAEALWQAYERGRRALERVALDNCEAMPIAHAH